MLETSDSELLFSDYSPSDYDDDDSEDEDIDEEEDEEDADVADGSIISSAPVQEQDAHRNMLGTVLQRLNDGGIDVDELAENAGIDSPDVTTLSNDDLAMLTLYLAQNHPDVLQSVAGRFPASQNILGALTGEGGGFLGRIFGG
jgi:hypothetical protein